MKARKVRFLHEGDSNDCEVWQKAQALLKVVAENGVSDESGFAELLYSVRQCGTQTDSELKSGLPAAVRKVWGRYEALDEKEFLQQTIPWLAKHAMELPELLPDGVSILAQNENNQIFLSRRQCAAVAAAAFFGLLPLQGDTIPGYNLEYVLHTDVPKLACFLCYYTQVSKESAEVLDHQFVSFARRAHNDSSDREFWATALDKPLIPAKVFLEGTIEGDTGALQADFANEYLGGGVLHGGNVQEEIRFAVCPECIVGMLFCECMLPHEAIFIVGAQQYSKYRGYGGSFQFDGPVTSRDALDGRQRADVHLVAFDALCFAGAMQYKEDGIYRELQKAYVACLGDPSEDPSGGTHRREAFATGNWGCGVFGGDPQLKSLIQWIAASANGRELKYYIYGDRRVGKLHTVFQAVLSREWNCRDLLKRLVSCNKSGQAGAVFDKILSSVMEESRLEEESEVVD